VNLLPWLLDWPPSPATIAVFVVLTTLSIGTLVVFGGAVDDGTDENVTVEEVDLTVALNDELSFPDGENGTVQTCMASGTPGDSISVLGDVVVEIPPDSGRGYAAERSATVEVSLAHTDETTTATVEGPGRETMDVFWILEDDETLSVGDTETVQVRVRIDGSRVTRATRNVTVQEGSRSYDC